MGKKCAMSLEKSMKPKGGVGKGNNAMSLGKSNKGFGSKGMAKPMKNTSRSGGRSPK